MVFLDFLKRFSKEEEPEEVSFDNLQEWIDSKSNEIVEKTNSSLLEIKGNIEEKKKIALENLKNLEVAELKNPDIPERAKSIMEGNRTAYIQKARAVIININFPGDCREVKGFFESFDKEMDSFSKSTVKSSNILMEFFVNEANAVFSNIRELDFLVKKGMNLVNDSEISKFNKLKNAFETIQSKIKQKEDLKENIKLKQENLNKDLEEIKEKGNSLKELEQGSKYKSFLELVDKNKLLEQELGELIQLISFSTILPALKKYERMTLDDKLVRKYLDDSLKALLEDTDLRIVEVLEKMKESIEKGDVELKDKKKDKILKELDNFNKNKFETFLEKYHLLNEKLNKLKLEMKENESILKDIKDLKTKLGNNQSKVKEKENKIKNMEKEMEDIDILSLKDNLKSLGKESINISIF